MNFSDRLIRKIQDKNTCVCVGIDPVIERIPISSPKEFCVNTLSAVAENCIAAKFNVAFFQALGLCGMELLYEMIFEAKNLDLITIVDGKYNDVGLSSEMYAKALFENMPKNENYRPDAITVNPYLGKDGITPFIEMANQYSGGIFVLAKTSNLSSGTIQNKKTGIYGEPLYEDVVELIRFWGEKYKGENGWSSVGAVVGATCGVPLQMSRSIADKTFFLIPGYGAQGGSVEDIMPVFNEQGLGAIVNSSRGIIYAYEDESIDKKQYFLAAEKSAKRMKKEINEAIQKENR